MLGDSKMFDSHLADTTPPEVPGSVLGSPHLESLFRNPTMWNPYITGRTPRLILHPKEQWFCLSGSLALSWIVTPETLQRNSILITYTHDLVLLVFITIGKDRELDSLKNYKPLNSQLTTIYLPIARQTTPTEPTPPPPNSSFYIPFLKNKISLYLNVLTKGQTHLHHPGNLCLPLI